MNAMLTNVNDSMNQSATPHEKLPQKGSAGAMESLELDWSGAPYRMIFQYVSFLVTLPPSNSQRSQPR